VIHFLPKSEDFLLFEIFLKCLCVTAKSSSSVCKQWKRWKSLSMETHQFCSILSVMFSL